MEIRSKRKYIEVTSWIPHSSEVESAGGHRLQHKYRAIFNPFLQYNLQIYSSIGVDYS